MGLTTAKLRDANVYVNGTSTHGQATEISLPNIQASKSEYKALGLAGTLKLFNGFDALEATIKWSSPNNEVKIACCNPKQVVDLMVRSSRDVYINGDLTEEQPVTVYLKGTCNNHGLGTLKPKDDTETETKIDLTYVKEVVNGQEIVELDIANNIFRIGGEDMLAKYRQNLGL
jgi:P2 family phage contractile tail tube protein